MSSAQLTATAVTHAQSMSAFAAVESGHSADMLRSSESAAHAAEVAAQQASCERRPPSPARRLVVSNEM